MLNGLHPRGSYIYIHGGNSATYISGQHGALGLGNVRFNTSLQQFEVFDGAAWVILNLPTAVVGLTPEAESLLDWVKVQKERETELQNLIKNNKAVKNSYDNFQKAKEQLDITIILSKNEKTTN